MSTAYGGYPASQAIDGNINTMAVTQVHGAYYTHYKLAAQLVQQSVSGGRSLTACASITYANPSNRPESSS